MKITICGHEIETLLDRAPTGLRVLSLDCFDTLIWRDTQKPTDVFAEIDLPGGGMEPRGWAEMTARRMGFNRTGKHEIGLEDIYRRLYPAADDAAIAAAVAHELAIEARHAFAYAPAVTLMREAKRRGLRVVIVSDMYVSEAQLRAHIAAAAGDEVVAMIDHVFVSSAHGVDKRGGLFDIVLNTLGVLPNAILHVGDNPVADYEAAHDHGLHAVHFRQFDAESEARLRLEAGTAIMIDPAVRTTRPASQPHRAQISLRREDDAAYVLGHDVLGPVMHTFSLWLKREVDDLAAKLGKPVRPLFMMRDGYLPYRTFDTLFPEVGARPVEISRFVAARSAMYDEASLDAYFSEWHDELPISAMARQLMLFDHEVAHLLKDEHSKPSRAAFVKLVRSPDMQRRIVKRNRGFGDKLLAHLGANDVKPGDAVMLVDIGYNGTVQNILEPMLRDRMGLDVAGRYVFLRQSQITGLDKRGMLDTRNYECRTLHGLATCVAVIEQLCNVEQGSTVNYDAKGTPIRESADMKAAHNVARTRAQDACLDFVREAGVQQAGRGIHRAPASDDLETRVHAAAAILGRLFFLPNAREVALFGSFNHDVNMGTKLSHSLFDAEDAQAGLRRRGLAYINDKRRMFVPAEVHGQGLPVNLAMFASSRFGLDLRSSDFDVGGIEVPVMLATATEQAVRDYTAYPTADGFYRLRVPVGAQRPTLGVQLGQLCELVQIEEAVFTRLSEVDSVRAADRLLAANPVYDGMTALATDLYEAGERGFMLVPPPPPAKDPLVLTLVFRPIRWRKAAEGGEALRDAA